MRPIEGRALGSGRSGTYVLEPESLITIAIYLLIGWGILALTRIVSTPSTRRVDSGRSRPSSDRAALGLPALRSELFRVRAGSVLLAVRSIRHLAVGSPTVR